MNEEQKELFFDLLTKKAVFGLDESEQAELDRVDSAAAEKEFQTLELTAAVISLAGSPVPEPMPAHLFAKIAADAEGFVRTPTPETRAAEPWPPAPKSTYSGAESAVQETTGGNWFGWLGWVAAAAACVALAINIWLTRSQNAPPPVVEVPRPEIPRPLTPAEMRDQMMAANPGMMKADWAAGNVDAIKQISGDVVWSDEKQAGYMRFRGLPANDPSKETYQLWIFDKTQDKKTPIDGGTFDVSADGEVVIPINAKLKAREPEMFAITIEQPGGVVVSKREKLAAIAKVQPASG